MSEKKVRLKACERGNAHMTHTPHPSENWTSDDDAVPQAATPQPTGSVAYSGPDLK
jgi:hypothetical protein